MHEKQNDSSFGISIVCPNNNILSAPQDLSVKVSDVGVLTDPVREADEKSKPQQLQKSQNYWLEKPALSLFLFTMLIFLVRIFLRGQNLELDEAEQTLLAQQLLPGYPSQPPLYTWMQYGFFKLFGLHLVSLALLKYSLLFACFYSFHHICRLHCQTALIAWSATLAWVFIPVISFYLLKDNTHSILALLSACLTWYWFIAPRSGSKITWYLIFGCLIGIGFLSKFNYLLFFIVLMGAALSLEEYRSKILQIHMWLALLVALSLCSSYLIWLFHNAQQGLHSTYKLVSADKTPYQGIIELFKASVFFIAPVLLASRLCFPAQIKLNKQTSANTLLIRYFILCLPIMTFLCLSLDLKNIQTRWLIPLFFLCPLLYFSQIKDSKQIKKRAMTFIWLCLFIELFLLLGLVYRSYKIKQPTAMQQAAAELLGK